MLRHMALAAEVREGQSQAGPKACPKSRQLEVGAQRAPSLLLHKYSTEPVQWLHASTDILIIRKFLSLFFWYQWCSNDSPPTW